jgi:uncharacterized protein YndB with AHSA1/START domain
MELDGVDDDAVVVTEQDLEGSAIAVWEHVASGQWLGEQCELRAEPGAEGTVVDDKGVRRVLLVESVEAPRLLVFRWASFDEAPTRVVVELSPSTLGTRVTVTEFPLPVAQGRAQALAMASGAH